MPFWGSRREFFAKTAALAAAMKLPALEMPKSPDVVKSPFRIAVINDEIAQDFGHACEVASQKLGMRWIELRSLWDKNVLRLDSHQIAEAGRTLKENNLQVTDIASPLFKVDWPDAPKSKFSPKRDQFNADFTFDQQGEVLDGGIELAKTLGTGRVRCFDFWRLEDQKPYRAAINEKLKDAANKAGKKGGTWVLEID